MTAGPSAPAYEIDAHIELAARSVVRAIVVELVAEFETRFGWPPSKEDAAAIVAAAVSAAGALAADSRLGRPQ